MVFNGAIQGLKNNSYHSQELLAATLAAVAVKLGSNMKYFSKITTATAAAAGANTAGLLVAVNSAHTVWTSKDAGEKKAAWKALGLAATGVTVATMTRATSVLHSGYKSLPTLTKFAKPLAVATGVGTVVAKGGLESVKYVSAFCAAWVAKSRQEALDNAVALVNGKDEAHVQGLDRENFIKMAAAAQILLATAGQARDESAKVNEDLRGWLNAKAAEFNKADATKIARWVDFERPNAILNADIFLVDGKNEVDIQGLNRDEFIEMAEAAKALLATAGQARDESDRVLDDQIGWINAKAATFVDADAIPGWVDLQRAAV